MKIKYIGEETGAKLPIGSSIFIGEFRAHEEFEIDEIMGMRLVELYPYLFEKIEEEKLIVEEPKIIEVKKGGKQK